MNFFLNEPWGHQQLCVKGAYFPTMDNKRQRIMHPIASIKQEMLIYDLLSKRVTADCFQIILTFLPGFQLVAITHYGSITVGLIAEHVLYKRFVTFSDVCLTYNTRECERCTLLRLGNHEFYSSDDDLE